MGCGSSSLTSGDKGNTGDALEVISKFPCNKIATLPPGVTREQLVVGRITSLSKSLTSPYSCQECALYSIDCYLNQYPTSDCGPFDKDHWKMVHSEVRAAAFELRDPEDASCSAVHVPGKVLAVQYANADKYAVIREDNSILLSECTPSISALLSRCGLHESDLKNIRIREWCVEENTQVGVFGVIAPVNILDTEKMSMKPLQVKVVDESITKFFTNQDEIRYLDIAQGGRTIVVLEDRRFFQGLKVKPFVGNVPISALPVQDRDRDSVELSLDDVSPDVVTPLPSSPRIRLPTTGETHVRIPAGAVPGSRIAVPGPRGSRIITITVPDDFKVGDTHVFTED